MGFWILIIALCLLVASGLVITLLRERQASRSSADFDIAVYRDQLSEVERDLARGVITEEAAERTRTEVSRRILDADRRRKAEDAARAPRRATLIAAAAVAALLLPGALGLYLTLGAPGYGDLPLQARLEQTRQLRENRPGQVAAEAQAAATPLPVPQPSQDYIDLVERLRQTVAERPGDLRGQTLLAQNEAVLGNFTAAHEAQARRLEILGERAQASDWADYADLLILAAGGYISPEAERALGRALTLEPANGTARYYSGLLFTQTGRPDLAVRVWQQLLEDSSPGAPWVAPIRAQIEDAAARAGIRYDLPPEQAPATPGPSADQMQAAEEMDPDERMEMIRGMVEGLAERLGTEGGAPEDWARLIGALGVLGETDRARSILDEGRQVFAGNDAAQQLLDRAAGQAGLLQ